MGVWSGQTKVAVYELIECTSTMAQHLVINVLALSESAANGNEGRKRKSTTAIST